MHCKNVSNSLSIDTHKKKTLNVVLHSASKRHINCRFNCIFFSYWTFCVARVNCSYQYMLERQLKWRQWEWVRCSPGGKRREDYNLTYKHRRWQALLFHQFPINHALNCSIAEISLFKERIDRIYQESGVEKLTRIMKIIGVDCKFLLLSILLRWSERHRNLSPKLATL